MIPITKIETTEQLIGVHTEEMCREGKYLECANCFVGPIMECDGKFDVLIIPRPVVPKYQIVDAIPANQPQLQLSLETT